MMMNNSVTSDPMGEQLDGDARSRESSRRLMQIAEREVGRIILDIHDGPVQNIFAVLSQLSILQRLLQRRFGDEADEAIERVGLSMSLLEHTLTDIRTFIGMFRPPEFEHRELIAVLDGLVIQHEELTGNPVELHVEGSIPPVSLAVKIALYRVLQEALSNSSRHANVNSHEILLAYDESQEHIIMEVRDTGSGFDVAAVLADHTSHDGMHIGLLGMQERVDILGGTFHIASTPGKGTIIRVVVPCQ